MRKSLLLLVLPLLLSCGVKERGTEKSNPPQVTQGQEVPEGVWVGKNKKFLLKASRSDFQQDPLFKVNYTVTTADLNPLGVGEELKIKYWMPIMPAMPVTPVGIKKQDGTQYEVTYDISMGGEWEFILTLMKDAKEVDSFTYRVKVPE